MIPGPEYRLGAGDLLEVQVAGRLEVTRHQVVVDLDGGINIPPLGAIGVGGLTLAEAYRKVVARARAFLRFVDIAISVIQPRSFEVVLSGELERPGAVLTSAFRRLHEVIQAAGGVSERGTRRRVRLVDEQGEREVDLLRFELTGDISQNPFVEGGMHIHVPPRGPSVTLTGAVRRPGEYELGPTGSLAELLALTGGFHASAARSEARLTRIGPDGRKETLAVDLATALARPADVSLQPGDVVFVPTVSVLQDVVEVRGAFAGVADSGKTTTAGKPTIVQRFELARGERVTDLVRRAGGPAPFGDLRLAMLERRAGSGPVQRIPVDLHRLLVEKDESQDVPMQNGDVLTLPVVEDKVYVVGEVRAPGAHDFRPDLGVREYVTLAGGPAKRAKIEAATLTFRDGRTYALKDAPPPEPGAVVTVPEVAVKWWQDYVVIANTVASLVAAYTGLFILFGARTTGVLGTSE
ncbi:MAG: SLBB domain-containing protein [Candidatus Rokubacteria bacterium]|nr:SLBB domain-containing protein [Candidatus Rokubacteria bacterium]